MDWIPFEAGEYWAARAFLVASNRSALALEAPFIKIGTGPRGQRYLKGQGLVRNAQVVALLEDDDRLDILLDLGGDFKYHLETPQISAGKLFAPDIKSTLQFAPLKPWRQLSVKVFDSMVSALSRVDD